MNYRSEMYHPVDYWAAVLFRKWVARDGSAPRCVGAPRGDAGRNRRSHGCAVHRPEPFRLCPVLAPTPIRTPGFSGGSSRCTSRIIRKLSVRNYWSGPRSDSLHRLHGFSQGEPRQSPELSPGSRSCCALNNRRNGESNPTTHGVGILRSNTL